MFSFFVEVVVVGGEDADALDAATVVIVAAVDANSLVAVTSDDNFVVTAVVPAVVGSKWRLIAKKTLHINTLWFVSFELVSDESWTGK